HRERVVVGLEAQADEAQLRRECGLLVDPLLQLLHPMRRERTPGSVAALRVDEAEDGDLAGGEPRERPRAALRVEDRAGRRGEDALQLVRARRRWREVLRRRRGRGEHHGQTRPRDHRVSNAVFNARDPSFMWCARPSFCCRKSTSNAGVSSFPSQLNARRNCSLSAPVLSQWASSEEVTYTRFPSQLCEIMFTCLPVTFS